MSPKDKSASGGSRGTLLASGLFFLGGVGAAAFVFLRPSGPELQALEPIKAHPGDSITLRGKGFDLIALRNTVIFGDRTGRVISAGPNQLSVEVPDLALAEGQSQSIPVRVVVGPGASSAIKLQVFREALASPPPPPTVETPEVVATASPAPKPPAPRPAPARTPPQPPPTQVAVVPPPPQVPRRQFVLERTAVESKKRVASELSGFDTTGVNVKRAPDVLGRVDFEVTPPDVKPGDHYTVNVYLINDGNKLIKVKDLFVATSVNGRLVSGPRSPRMTEVNPRHKEMVATFSDVWKDSVASWAMDVTVTSDRGDVYKNQVIWK